METIMGLMVLALVLNQHGAEGARSRTAFKDMNLEEQLMILNKPPIKTFHTEEGDIYDCVDIYKQPAFDYPLLKNHQIQMRPTSQPEGLMINEPASVATSSFSNGVRCSQGSVPIRRTRKEDLIRVKSLSDEYQQAKTIHPHSTLVPNQHLVYLSPKNQLPIYYGARASISVHRPDINNDQYTTAQIWLEKGPIEQYSGIQAGWMIGPQITGDNFTRSFMYWSKDNSKSHCFNQLCPGFVQVHKEVTIGSVLQEISVDGEAQKRIGLAVFQDIKTGHWWFQLNDTINVGYLPTTLLPHLAEGVTDVSWGGLAANPPNGFSPPMGNGRFPEDDFTRAASFTQAKFIDTTNTYRTPNEIDLIVSVENNTCYNLENYGKFLNSGLAFLYGGPGGCRD